MKHSPTSRSLLPPKSVRIPILHPALAGIVFVCLFLLGCGDPPPGPEVESRIGPAGFAGEAQAVQDLPSQEEIMEELGKLFPPGTATLAPVRPGLSANVAAA